MKQLFVIYIVVSQLLGCVKGKKSDGTNIIDDESNRTVKTLKILDAGGPEYPPFILLKIYDGKTIEYSYDERLNFKDSIIIEGKVYQQKYSSLFKKISSEFINSSGGNFSSPVDDSGILFEIKLNNDSINRWCVFLNDYKYDPKIKEYTNNVIKILKEN